MKPFKVISLVLAVAVPVVGLLATRYGGGFKLSVPSSSEGSAPAEDTGLGDVGPVVRLDPFVVSEWKGNGQHVSTVTFEVEVSDTSGRDAVKSRSSAIRSAILAVLADTNLSDVGDPEELAALKRKVQGRVQSLLPNHLVRRVLITEFLSL
jgi:flagellar basal body-associated protein FliL